MEKKSVARSVIFKKTGSGNNGEYHIFEITFDNGDKGDYVTKKNPQDYFKEGAEVAYTIETVVNGQYTNYKVRPVQANGFVPGKGNPSYEHKRVALKCATDMVCSGKVAEKDILTASDKLFNWLNA